MGKGMRAGKRKTKMGGGDMQKQLKQMQAMQREMEQSQAELAEREFTSTAGGGAVLTDAKQMLQKVNLTMEQQINYNKDLVAQAKELLQVVEPKEEDIPEEPEMPIEQNTNKPLNMMSALFNFKGEK